MVESIRWYPYREIYVGSRAGSAGRSASLYDDIPADVRRPGLDQIGGLGEPLGFHPLWWVDSVSALVGGRRGLRSVAVVGRRVVRAGWCGVRMAGGPGFVTGDAVGR